MSDERGGAMNPATALARVLVDELLRCGMTEAVLAPGSRSTPLAMELHDAQLAGRLRLHVRIDERSAAFLALGLAKTTGIPVAVVCTSGTAAANLYPAVVEADEAGVPLLVLTADRPPELRHIGANQAVDQIKLYGSTVRWFCEVGAPEPRAGMVSYWRSLACRAWARVTGSEPGPVHLNLAFREPLVPDEDGGWPEPLAGRPDGAPWTRGLSPEPTPVTLPEAERGVLVVGDATADVTPLVEHAEAMGWPVLAEPTGNARRGRNAISTYHFLLSAERFAAAHRPEVVVSTGRPGLSKPLLAYLQAAGEHIVVSGYPRWLDPTRSASAAVPASGIAARGGARPFRRSGRGEWLAEWLAAEAAARSAVDGVLDGIDEPSEPRLARDLAAEAPGGALLWTSSSTPIRDLDQTMAPRHGLRLLTNRGASGIDGVVSAAVGAALAHQSATDGPGYALVGDLALLHDQNGLIIGPQEARPDLAIVVVNNDGGGIFSMLPQTAFPESFERLFGTPHGVDIAAVAAATRTPYRLLERMPELPDAIKGDGLRIVEVRADRNEGAALRARLQDAVTEAVRVLG